MNEFIGLKSLLGVYGYKFQGVIPSLLAYENKELITKIKPQYLRSRETKSMDFSPQDLINLMTKEADYLRFNIAKEGLLNELKRELLLFDKIYVCPLEYGAILDDGVNELEEILKREYFQFSESCTSPHSGPLAEATTNTYRKLMSYWPCLYRVKNNDENFISNIEVDREEVEKLFYKLKDLGFKTALKEFTEFGQFNNDIQARRDAEYLNKKYDMQVVPLVNSDISFDISSFISINASSLKLRAFDQKEENVAHIILNKLPFPAKDVPISKVLDFKEDSDTRRLLLGMKRWLRKTLESNISLKELNEEIEYLIMEYTHYMKLYDMKITTGTLETLVVTSAEIIENVAKLNLGKAAKSLFSIRNRHLALVEAEMKAPGREVSYIVHANQKFN
jgi:hypothetical protein